MDEALDGPGHKSDFARLVGVDGAGNVTISGTTNTDNRGEDWITVSYAAGGHVRLRTSMYDDGPFQVMPADECVAANSAVYLTAQAHSGRESMTSPVSVRSANWSGRGVTRVQTAAAQWVRPSPSAPWAAST